MSEPFVLSGDDALLRALDGMLDEVEPLPGHLSASARALFELGGLDSELAQLTYDSWTDRASVPVRDDGDGGRVLVYATADGPGDNLSVELVISADGSLLGQLVPAVVCTIRVQTPTGETTVMSDSAGSFQFARPSAQFRLLVVGGHGSVVTVWIDPQSS